MKMSQRWQGGNIAGTAYKLKDDDENGVVNDDDEISNEIVNICV